MELVVKNCQKIPKAAKKQQPYSINTAIRLRDLGISRIFKVTLCDNTCQLVYVICTLSFNMYLFCTIITIIHMFPQEL